MRLTWRQRNEYDLLEVPLDASEEDIKAAYRFQSKAWHPDGFRDDAQKAEATERMAALTEAYKSLSDPLTRRRIDRSAGFAQTEVEWTLTPEQADPETWKRMAGWMKDEDVGTGFDRKMAFTAGDLLERGRQPSEKQLPHVLRSWETAVAAGFSTDE